MKPLEYQKLAVRTESREFYEVDPRLLHAGLGLATEAGEFLDVIKRRLFYGDPESAKNLGEELGDVLWYVAIACEALDIDLGEVMRKNINKLKVRYPEKFTQENALNRDLDREGAEL